MSEIQKLIQYRNVYGGEMTIDGLISKIKGDRIYQCPKCSGKGSTSVRCNAYPSGLPDSGWVDDWKYKDVQCDLCQGFGYNNKEYKPKMIQNGWE
jgi:hypothetical protein